MEAKGRIPTIEICKNYLLFEKCKTTAERTDTEHFSSIKCYCNGNVYGIRIASKHCKAGGVATEQRKIVIMEWIIISFSEKYYMFYG